MLSVGPMYWLPFNRFTDLIPTKTTIATTTPTDKAIAKTPSLVVPGGLSLKHFVALGLNLVNFIVD
jgi:hypothetical protein